MRLARTLPDGSTDIVREIVTEDVYRLRSAPNLVGGVVIDLGANIGVFTLHALALGASRVVSVEPFPSNVEMLRENIAVNGAGDTAVVVESACVGRHRDLAMACAGAQAFCGHGPDVDWMRRALSQPGAAPRVTTVTLCDLLERHSINMVAMLKIDIEGMEIEVITDTPNDILARCDLISIEVDAHPPGALGRLVEHLAETHFVEVLGSPRRGCYVYARRYGI